MGMRSNVTDDNQTEAEKSWETRSLTTHATGGRLGGNQCGNETKHCEKHKIGRRGE